MTHRLPLPLKLAGLSASSCLALLLLYAYLLRATEHAFPIKVAALATVAACFAGCGFVTYQSSAARKDISGIIRALLAAAVITGCVIVAFLAIATVLFGA